MYYVPASEHEMRGCVFRSFWRNILVCSKADWRHGALSTTATLIKLASSYDGTSGANIIWICVSLTMMPPPPFATYSCTLCLCKVKTCKEHGLLQTWIQMVKGSPQRICGSLQALPVPRVPGLAPRTNWKPPVESNPGKNQRNPRNTWNFSWHNVEYFFSTNTFCNIADGIRES